MFERIFTQPFLVVASIIERDGKILLAKQGRAHARGLWDLPAGWVDLGEDPLKAVVRETKEETGLDFEPTHLVGIYSYVRPRISDPTTIMQAVSCIFRGRITGDLSKDNEEVIEHGWFLPAEIQAMDQNMLRTMNIKHSVKDYVEGRAYPLEVIKHASELI